MAEGYPRTAMHSTWCVIGNRSNARSDSSRTRADRGMRRPAPARPGRTRRRRSARGAGPRCARHDRGRRRSAAGRARPGRCGSAAGPADGPPGRRVHGASSTSAGDAGCCASRRRRAPVDLDGEHRTGRAHRVRERRGEQADARVQVQRRAPRLGAGARRARGRRSVGAAPGWTCQNPRAATRNSRRPLSGSRRARDVRWPSVPSAAGRRGTASAALVGGDRIDGGAAGPAVSSTPLSMIRWSAIRQSSTGTISWRPVLAQPGTPVGVDGELDPRPPPQPRVVTGSASTVTSTSRPARRWNCSRTTCGLQLPLVCRASACCQSQPPHRPARIRARRLDPVRRRPRAPRRRRRAGTGCRRRPR